MLRKKGQGRKSKLTEKQLETLKKLSERDDWLAWEIKGLIKRLFHTDYHLSYIVPLLKNKGSV